MRQSLVKQLKVLMIAISAMALFASLVSASPEKIKISYADYGSSEHMRADQVRDYFDTVKKAAKEQLDIELEVKYHWGGSLIGDDDQVSGLSEGLADSGLINTPYYPAQFPLHMGGYLPFGIEEFKAATLAWNELYDEFPELNKELAKNNLVILWPASLPTIQLEFTTKEPVTKLEDLKGLRLRADSSFAKAAEALGAVAVSMPFTEVYSALEKGSVDGSMTYIFSILPFRHHEVIDYYLDCKLGVKPGNNIIAMNKDKWETLPPDLQKIMREKGKNAIANMDEMLIDVKKETYEAMEEEGVEIMSIDSEEKERWAEKVRPVVWGEWEEEMEEKGLPGTELKNRYFELGDIYK